MSSQTNAQNILRPNSGWKIAYDNIIISGTETQWLLLTQLYANELHVNRILLYFMLLVITETMSSCYLLIDSNYSKSISQLWVNTDQDSIMMWPILYLSKALNVSTLKEGPRRGVSRTSQDLSLRC